MIRTIEGFHQDEQEDWVAELSCLHSQHVRHEPPFRERPWVLSASGRLDRIGSPIECPLCDRAELPDGLVEDRIAGPFDQDSLPAGLRRDHRLADRTWAVLVVLDGGVTFEIASRPPLRRRLDAGDRQAIPPGVTHRVVVDDPFRLELRFLVPAGRSGPAGRTRR